MISEGLLAKFRIHKSFWKNKFILDSEIEAVSQPLVLNVKSLILFAFC
ncbi:MAG: hypothetical protein RL095_3916 [Verrucomicrobiota bacterium]|jgi:hypothetical protein